MKGCAVLWQRSEASSEACTQDKMGYHHIPVIYLVRASRTVTLHYRSVLLAIVQGGLSLVEEP